MIRSSLQQIATVDLFIANTIRSSIDLSTLTVFAVVLNYPLTAFFAAVRSSIDLFIDNMVRSNISAAQNRLDDHSLQ